MPDADPDELVHQLAAESIAADDPTGWFERLYVAAADDASVVPWDRGAPHPMLVEWVEAKRLTGAGRRALVVGCGLGADAEYVAGLGYDTTAFDVSETAVHTARDRFPGSPVRYLAADLLDPPAAWREAFELVAVLTCPNVAGAVWDELAWTCSGRRWTDEFAVSAVSNVP